MTTDWDWLASVEESQQIATTALLALAGSAAQHAGLSNLAAGLLLKGRRPIFMVGPVGRYPVFIVAYGTVEGVKILINPWLGSLEDFETKVAAKYANDEALRLEFEAAIHAIKCHFTVWESPT
jgi:hypothetical protein